MSRFDNFFEVMEATKKEAIEIIEKFIDNNPTYDFFDNGHFFSIDYRDTIETTCDCIESMFKGVDGKYKVQTECGIIDLDEVLPVSIISLGEFIHDTLLK